MIKRVFLSINVAEEAQKSIKKILLQLKEKNFSRVISFVKPENLHCTLHFLGNRTYEEIANISRIVSSRLAIYKPFEITLGNFSGFPNMKFPKVLYLEGNGNSEYIGMIQTNLMEGLESLGIQVDKRPWVCHFTLARIKEKIAIDIKDIHIETAIFRVKEVFLMESRLRESGPEYFIIEKFPLG